MSDPIWYKKAKEYIGLKEYRGSRHNKTVLEMYGTVGHGWVKEDEVPWCAAFVGHCLEETGYRSTRQLTARSYLQWGKSIKNPRRGDVVVFRRGNSSWQGHVGFVDRVTSSRVYTLGGNQSNAVNIKGYAKKSLLGYRRPRSPAASRTLRGQGIAGASTAALASLDGLSAGVDALAAMSDTIQPLIMQAKETGIGEWMPIILIGLIFVGIGIAVYAYFDDLQNKRLT
jgi:uncharacterized protein (TIGR02594 family)